MEAAARVERGRVPPLLSFPSASAAQRVRVFVALVLPFHSSTCRAARSQTTAASHLHLEGPRYSIYSEVSPDMESLPSAPQCGVCGEHVFSTIVRLHEAECLWKSNKQARLMRMTMRDAAPQLLVALRWRRY